MINMGTDEVKVLEDGWTVVTKDGRFSAHFEDTVAILPEGPENLTRIDQTP
jgi:methionyl aminopeptidase